MFRKDGVFFWRIDTFFNFGSWLRVFFPLMARQNVVFQVVSFRWWDPGLQWLSVEYKM
jgi:hypothetical protein